jgi:hypothetical protein
MLENKLFNQFMSSGIPVTLWTEFYSQNSSYSFIKYLENHAPSHLSYDTSAWETVTCSVNLQQKFAHN